jgi:hypothetical protein
MPNSIGIVKQLRPGDDIDTYCGRCKEERVHAIIALGSVGEIQRVQCRTCLSTHLYRDKDKKPGRARAAQKTAMAAPAHVGPARAYSMQDRFRIGERISHPKFGLGTVIDERPGKIDVRFGKEVRTLVQAS